MSPWIQRIILWFCLLGLVPLSVSSQQAPAAGKTSTPDYSQEAFVVEQIRTRLVYENDGTGSRYRYGRVRIQSDAGVKEFGLLVFPYANANETLDVVSVKVTKPDGTVVVTPAVNVQDLPSDVTRVAPSYTDLRQKHVVVKALGVGDVLENEIRERIHTPLIPGHFWMEDNFFSQGISLDEEIEVSVPAGRALKVKTAGTPPAIREEGGRRIYVWKSSNRERKRKDPEAEAEEAEKDKPPDVQLSTFQNWEEIGRWYYTLQQERATPTPEIRAKAAELIKGATSDSEKLRAIYDFVATKFRYIGISFGIGRMQPHPAAEVLDNQYGDCKDKHTLLASLLHAAGLNAYPALIHSARKLDPEMPSPTQFDHLISVVPQGNELLWLDTTPEVAPFGMLGVNLRDKEALVMAGARAPALVKTPPEPPFPSFQTFQVEGKLDSEGTLDAKVERTTRGDPELLFRIAFRQVPQPQWKDLAQRLSYLAGFGGDVSDVTASVPEKTMEPFRYNYHYVRKEYSDWENGRITPPMPPMNLPQIKKEGPKPKDPLELGATQEIVLRAKVQLPAGSAPQLPPAVSLKERFAEYSSSYSLEGGVLQAERRLVIKARKVQPEDFLDYVDFREAIVNDEGFYILLSGIPGAGGRFTLDLSNPEAARQVQEGRQAYERHDLFGAVAALQRAVAADPKAASAWMLLGTARMAINETARGLEALRTATEVAPENPLAHKTLAFALMAQSRFEEALPVWRTLLKVDPKDRDADANLAIALMQLKRHQEAIPHLESAAALNPGSVAIQGDLGDALLGAGQPEKAMEAFRKAMQMDPSAETLNNVAYELAEKRVYLPEALKFSEKAVEEVEEALRLVHLDDLETEGLRRINSLAADWDTLGWVHFRQGNLARAEEYLRAAWVLSQNGVVGDHLGQVYEKQGKKLDAARTYAHAIASNNPPKEARNRLRTLLGSSAKAEARIRFATSELSMMRAIRLPRVTKGKASAEFFLLFVPGGKVEEVRFISGDEALAGAVAALKAARFDVPFPSGSSARIIRRGILACSSSGTGCDFVLFTPDIVRTVE